MRIRKHWKRPSPPSSVDSSKDLLTEEKEQEVSSAAVVHTCATWATYWTTYFWACQLSDALDEHSDNDQKDIALRGVKNTGTEVSRHYAIQRNRKVSRAAAVAQRIWEASLYINEAGATSRLKRRKDIAHKIRKDAYTEASSHPTTTQRYGYRKINAAVTARRIVKASLFPYLAARPWKRRKVCNFVVRKSRRTYKREVDSSDGQIIGQPLCSKTL